MNTRLKAHIDSGNLILDEPLPHGLQNAQVFVFIEQLPQDTNEARPEERAQSESGFAREVLMDPSENVWDHE